MSIQFNTSTDRTQGSNSSSSVHISKCYANACFWLGEGYWPVVIAPIDAPGSKPGKRPVAGEGWGAQYPTEAMLAELYAAHPTAGLGLLLGDPRRYDDSGALVGDETKWLVDVEVDDEEQAAPVLARLFPDGVPPTLGWASNRGRHWLFQGDARLAKYGKIRITGEERDGKVVGNAAYVGVELRIGTIDPARPQQLQSVIPPSLKADGTPRAWIKGGVSILPLPYSVYEDLDARALPPAAKKTARKAPGSAVASKAVPVPQSATGGNGETTTATTAPAAARTYDRSLVRDWIVSNQDRLLDLLQELGVRLTGQCNDDGWLECHAVDRPDENPSAGVQSQTGVYHDFATDEDWSLFDLAVRCRPDQYPDWQAAVNQWGARFDPVREDGQTGDDAPATDNQARSEAGPYGFYDGVLVRWELVSTKDGPTKIPVPLANFAALAVEEIKYTTGATERLMFRIQATRPTPAGEQVRVVEVLSTEFESMAWVAGALGVGWSVSAGRGRKDQAREAIQLLSAAAGVGSSVCYEHTGWVRLEGVDAYLHAGGAIGPAGAVPGVRVEVPDLGLYRFPNPGSGAELTTAIQSCLRLAELGVANRPGATGIAAAVCALPWRAVLRPCNFAIAFVGGSGSRKTTVACLVVQHFAAGHTYTEPTPASWQQSAAHLEYMQHRCKDAVLLVDNFIADGGDRGRREQGKASTVLNNQGDLKGRARMRPDMTPLPELPPRGALLSTGEDSVARGSARGRSLFVPFVPEAAGVLGSVDLAILTTLQTDAAAGQYALAMASYIQHVAVNRSGVLARLDALAAGFKARLEVGVGHTRTPGILAELAAGYRLFLDWAVLVSAVDRAEADARSEQHWNWLVGLVAAQAEAQAESDDAVRFVGLVVSALGSGRGVLVNPDGKPPEGPLAAAAGWAGGGGVTAIQIGWLDDDVVYLDENAAMGLVQRLADEAHAPLSAPDTVRARLAEKGWLLTETTGGKTRHKVRRWLGGVRRAVLGVQASLLWPPAEEAAPPLA